MDGVLCTIRPARPTFRDRQKIFDRLITYLFGGHGHALFIENGKIKEHTGERMKQGSGVLWLNSASGAVTRSAVAIRQTLGPGVHFMRTWEYVAGTVDLHVQVQSIGPKESDKPFEGRKEEQPQEEWDQIQDRRKQVSALTRDGIEVIPNISVLFRSIQASQKKGNPVRALAIGWELQRKTRKTRKRIRKRSVRQF